MLSSSLDLLRLDFLHAFFASTRDFYLAGGGALIVFYQWPRDTQDLDLFCPAPEVFAHVDALVATASASINAAWEQVRSSPYFSRYLVRRGEATLQVDLVYEPGPQAHPDKAEFDGVRVDVPEEIFASKIRALVHRAEPRDFWDVFQFVQRGYSFDAALADAAVKEGGIDEESLVMVLSDISWEYLHAGARKAGLSDFDRVEEFFKGLIPTLARRLLPP